MNLCKYVVCGADGYVEAWKVNRIHLITGHLENSYSFIFPRISFIPGNIKIWGKIQTIFLQTEQ